MFIRCLTNYQVILMAKHWNTKGLPTSGDYGFISGPDAWEYHWYGGSLTPQQRLFPLGDYCK